MLFHFLPNISVVSQHALSLSEVYWLSVEEVAASKQQRVNAMVKKKKQDWPISLVCSLDREHVTHALDTHFTLPCSCAASHMPTELCYRAPRSLGSHSCSWSVTNCPARLECGAVEQDKCQGVIQKKTSGKYPKNVSLSKILMQKEHHLISRSRVNVGSHPLG